MELDGFIPNTTQIEITNISKNCGTQSESEIRDWNSNSKISFTIMVFILSLSLIAVNSAVLFSILRNRLRPVSCMIAHLAFVSIFASGSLFLWIVGLDKTFKHLWLCCLFSYLRNMCLNLISLGVAGISYERFRSLDENTTGVLILRRLIGFIWFFSCLGAVPSLFTTVLVHHVTPCGQIQSMCMKASPLENFYLGIVYELFRALFFHIGVSVYLLYELWKVRKNLDTFYKFGNKTNGLQRKMRLISLNSITFVLLWVPFGALLELYKNTVQSDRHAEFKEKGFAAEKHSNVKSPFFYAMFFLFYIYILLMPLLLAFCTNEALFKKRKRTQTKRENDKSKFTQRGDTTRNLSSTNSNNL